MNPMWLYTPPATQDTLSETHDGLSEIVPPINIHFDKANAKQEYRTRHKHSAVVLVPKEHIPKAR